MMNKQEVKGNWHQFKGEIKKTWGKLTDDDVALVEGDIEKFYGKVLEKQGVAKKDAEQRINEFQKKLKYKLENA